MSRDFTPFSQVVRKVVRRTAGVEEKGRRKRGKRSRQASRAEQEEEMGPRPHREHTEVGLVCSADANASAGLQCSKRVVLEI